MKESLDHALTELAREVASSALCPADGKASVGEARTSTVAVDGFAVSDAALVSTGAATIGTGARAFDGARLAGSGKAAALAAAVAQENVALAGAMFPSVKVANLASALVPAVDTSGLLLSDPPLPDADDISLLFERSIVELFDRAGKSFSLLGMRGDLI